MEKSGVYLKICIGIIPQESKDEEFPAVSLSV
jgi:hypothetical protein